MTDDGVTGEVEVRRWLVREHGAPADVLELGRTGVPAAHDDQLVIDVEACALNFADDLLCRGKYQEKPPLPFTPGLEMAGVVVDAPPGARYGRGDRVVGPPNCPTARWPSGARPASTTCIACPPRCLRSTPRPCT